MPNVSRATRAEMMLELSPLETAANASAFSAPASMRTSRWKPWPTTWRPRKSGPEPAEGLGLLVDDRDLVPEPLQARAERGADAPAPHHHDVHALILPGR